MALLLQLTVTPATQDQFNELDAKVGQSMMQAGGPPAGLMSHAVYPEGEGFVIAEVWRAEVSMTLENGAIATVENEATQADWMGDLSGGLGIDPQARRGWGSAAAGCAGSGGG